MLSEITIRNFAIIDELRLTFQGGFCVLTGETGAGKSIILDAVMLVLGGRADTAMIRAGSEQAYVEATFALDARLRALLLPVLEAESLDDEPGDLLVLAREIRQNGRNLARVNGRTVSLTLLRDIASVNRTFKDPESFARVGGTSSRPVRRALAATAKSATETARSTRGCCSSSRWTSASRSSPTASF